MNDVPLPLRLLGRPRDRRGFVVPFFVQWFADGERSRPGHGEPDFRVKSMEAGISAELRPEAERKRCVSELERMIVIAKRLLPK